MKVYSAESITRPEVDAIDAKQTEQIKKLRVMLAVSFAANVLLTVVLHLL